MICNGVACVDSYRELLQLTDYSFSVGPLVDNGIAGMNQSSAEAGLPNQLDVNDIANPINLDNKNYFFPIGFLYPGFQIACHSQSTRAAFSSICKDVIIKSTGRKGSQQVIAGTLER